LTFSIGRERPALIRYRGWDMLGFVLRTIGRRVLEKAFENSVKGIEARNEAATVRAAA
jgi:hypothetical protein